MTKTESDRQAVEALQQINRRYQQREQLTLLFQNIEVEPTSKDTSKREHPVKYVQLLESAKHPAYVQKLFRDPLPESEARSKCMQLHLRYQVKNKYSYRSP